MSVDYSKQFRIAAFCSIHSKTVCESGICQLRPGLFFEKRTHLASTAFAKSLAASHITRI